MSRRPYVWTLVSCLVAATAAAQEPAPDAAPQMNLPTAPEVVVEGQLDGIGSQGTAVASSTELESSNLTPTPLADTGSSVTVITAEQIAQRAGQQSVADILRGTAGLDVVRTGSPGNITTIFLRGAGGQHTKVLIDGIPANDPGSANRAFDFANLTVDNIERIEVIRGPQSVLYGSDAIGGVINIITKKGQGANTGRISQMTGAFNTSDSTAATSGSVGGVYYSAGGSYYDTDGFSSAAGGAERDRFMLGTFSSRFGWEPSENFNVDVVVRYNQGNSDIDFPPADDPNDSNIVNQVVTGVRLHNRIPAGWYEHTLAFYYSDIERGLRSPANGPGGFDFVGTFIGTTQQVDSRHTFHLLDGGWFGNSLTVGGLYYTENASSETVFAGFPSSFPNTSLDDGAVYGENQLRFGDNCYATLGYRSDHYNAYGAQDTYRCTTLYRLPEAGTAFRGSIGTGFRAPSLFERFDPFSGNPNLLPESCKGWDCGIEQPFFGGDIVSSVTYFRNDFSNFIDFNTFFQAVNVPFARTSGIEFNTLFVLDDMTTLTTSYTYTDTENPSTATPPPLGTEAQLFRRPRNKFGIVFNRQFLNRRLNWNVNMNYVGERDDRNFVGARTLLDPYFLLNTGVVFNATRHLQVFGRIDNLLNEDYFEAFGYNTASAAGYAGAALVW